MKADGAQPQTGCVVSALCADFVRAAGSTLHPYSEFRGGNGARGSRTKLGDDGNQTGRAEITGKRMPTDCRRRREESLIKNPKAGNRNESRDLDSYKTKFAIRNCHGSFPVFILGWTILECAGRAAAATAL
ncbi:MAG: hypothetical protein ACLPRE_01285, partial [Limisphaerales bacterium]